MRLRSSRMRKMRGSGLIDALDPRDDDIVEPRQERESLALRRKRLGRPVRERVDRDASLLQMTRARRPSRRSRPESFRRKSPVPGLDQIDLGGMSRHELAGGFGERSPRILLLVPFRRADLAQESAPSRRRRRGTACGRDGAGSSRGARRPGRRWRRCARSWSRSRNLREGRRYFGNISWTCARSCQFAALSGRATL